MNPFQVSNHYYFYGLYLSFRNKNKNKNDGDNNMWVSGKKILVRIF